MKAKVQKEEGYAASTKKLGEKYSKRNVGSFFDRSPRGSGIFLSRVSRYPRTRYRGSPTFRRLYRNPLPLDHRCTLFRSHTLAGIRSSSTSTTTTATTTTAIRYRSDTRCISAATTFLLPLLARWKRMAVCERVGPVEWLKTISRPDIHRDQRK